MCQFLSTWPDVYGLAWSLLFMCNCQCLTLSELMYKRFSLLQIHFLTRRINHKCLCCNLISFIVLYNLHIHFIFKIYIILHTNMYKNYKYKSKWRGLLPEVSKLFSKIRLCIIISIHCAIMYMCHYFLINILKIHYPERALLYLIISNIIHKYA